MFLILRSVPSRTSFECEQGLGCRVQVVSDYLCCLYGGRDLSSTLLSKSRENHPKTQGIHFRV